MIWTSPDLYVYWFWRGCNSWYLGRLKWKNDTLIARFMGPTRGPPGADRTQVGPIWATWTLLSGYFNIIILSWTQIVNVHLHSDVTFHAVGCHRLKIWSNPYWDSQYKQIRPRVLCVSQWHAAMIQLTKLKTRSYCVSVIAFDLLLFIQVCHE